MTKLITPETIEEAIEWLDTQEFICHALPAALSGYPYISKLCENKYIIQAENFLLPLLKRDNISTGGSWESLIYPYDRIPFSRADWLRKIAQELREGKI